MSQTITTAAREYARRSKDESFSSVQALVMAAQQDKQLSAERAYNLKDLRVVPVDDSYTGAQVNMQTGTSLRLQSPRGTAKFTHWSFGQTCRMIDAPAAYLRELPPTIAADAINFGLQDSAPGTTANLLVKANGGEPLVRACTSDSYGRCWDADLYGSVAYQLTDRDSKWQLPPVWGEPGAVAGAYRGDRDSFLIVTNGGSIVNDPSAASGTGEMYRGLMIRNSEVGASSVVIETILYRYICGNHMLWGALYDSRFKRRHVGSHVTRDVVREIGRIAYQWAGASTERDNAIIRTLIDREVAHSKEAVVDELRKMGATKEQAETAYDKCEQTERVSPRTFWGVAQGLTRLSQESEYQDERYELDRLAAVVMARGLKVAA
jgi:hypothetical protein